MAYSYIRYTGNGSTTNYTFNFPYLDQAHIKVRLNGTLTTLFTFLNASTIQLTSAPASGVVIEIRRETPKDNPIVNFTDGSVLLERDLDLLVTYDLYLAQETADVAGSVISQDSLGVWQAQSKRIANVADPVNAQDAVTKNYFESVYTPQLDAKVTAAAGSATNAANSATASASSAATASTKASEASTSAANAASSATAAASSASSASTSAGTATTQAGIAITQAGNAASSASAASTSAANAATSATSAANSASGASTSATNAATSATNAGNSATSAGNSATTATTKATEAGNSATAAASSASTASTQAANASSSASSASTSATNAAASATTASTGATTATTKASEAATSATNAANSATAAASSATSASTSASTATTQATNAANSATAANSSAVSAASSAASAAALLDNFDDRYLGPKSSAPSLDNDGNALLVGALYFDSTTGKMRVYTASGWLDASSASVATLAVFNFTATAGQTSFSGADIASQTLAYTVGAIFVTLNGIDLKQGTDYTATTGSSIVLTSGAAAGDELRVYAFGSFLVADAYTRAQADAGFVAKTGSTMTGSLLLNATQAQVKVQNSSPTQYSPLWLRDTNLTSEYTVDLAPSGVVEQWHNDGSTWRPKIRFAAGSGVELPYGQLKFPANQNASSDANTLDDYEEGTWTPTLQTTSGSPTYTSQLGSYTKVGRLVTVGFFLYISSKNTLATGTLRIGGLPFNISNSQEKYECVKSYIDWYQPSGTPISALRLDGNNNSNLAYFYKIVNTQVDGTGSVFSTSDVNAVFLARGTLTYMVD